MRGLLVILIVAAPVIAAAKPSVAVAPLDGDNGNKVGNAIAKAADKDASSVTGPKETGKAMEKLDLSGELDKKQQKKLRTKLEVDVLIQGKVEEDGDEKSVELSIAGKGVKAGKIKLRFKSVTASKFKSDLKAQLAKKLSAGDAEPDEDEEDKPKKHDDEEDKPKKHADDEDRPKKRMSEDDDDNAVHKKKKHRHDDDEGGDEVVRHQVTQVAIRLNAGAGFGRRGLTYDASGVGAPPSVGTASPSARVEVEAYPGAMSTLKGVAAGLGLYGEFDKSFAVGIKVPGSMGKTAPISQQHYGIGVRYRVVFGQNAVAFGVGYEARQYVAERGGLGMGVTLDMPDAKYSAIAPNVVGRFAATPTIGIFAGGGVLLLLDAGQIATKDGFGHAKSLAFEAAGGADIALAKGYGLRVAAELNQVGLSFTNTVRGVSKATDRTIGLVATFEVLY